MAEQNWAQCAGWLLVDEGGWANRKTDRGGKTNRGITLATFQVMQRRHPELALPEHLEDLSEHSALNIYHLEYWIPSHAAIAQPGVDLALMNTAVMSGTYWATKLLQRALGFPREKQDGMWGPFTEDAQRMANGQSLGLALLRTHLNFCKGIKGPDGWDGNGNGWTNRYNRNVQRVKQLAPH